MPWVPALQFWQLEALLAAVVCLTALEVPALLRGVEASGRVWLGGLAAGMLAVALTAGLAPRTNRILYDEHIYQHVGQNLADRHRAEMCNDGAIVDGRLECTLAEYNKQPNGYPHLLSVVYRVAGVDEGHAWIVNNIAAGLLPLVVCAATTILFADRRAAVLAALAAALVPQQLIWSNTPAVEPTAALAGAAAVLAAAWYASSGRGRALAWTVVTTAWACQFRVESPLIVPVVAALVLTRFRDEWRRPRFWLAGATGLLLLVPVWFHFAIVSGQSWGATGERMSAAFFGSNLAVNGPFYLTNVRFPLAFTLLAVVGIGARRGSPVLWVVVGYFAAFWSIYLGFYAGSYDHGADVRFSLLTYPPLAILAGLGASAVAGRRWLPAGRFIVPVAMAASCVSFVPLVSRVGEDGWQARADVAAAREFATLVPPGGVVLTHNPSMFLLLGVDAAQLSLAVADPDALPDRIAPRAPGGVYYHHNFWCVVPDPVQNRFCTEFRARFDVDLVAERQARDVRYALYRVRTRS